MTIQINGGIASAFGYTDCHWFRIRENRAFGWNTTASSESCRYGAAHVSKRQKVPIGMDNRGEL